jgi:hypothetical protein
MSGRAGSVRQLWKVVPVLVAAAALAGCGASKATPAAATPIPTEAPTSAEITPSPTPEAAPTETIAATPTPTPTPEASPTSRAAGCTGSADNQAFFADAAAALSFHVYCAVLPSGWWLQTASYVLPAGGFLQAEYKSSGGAGFSLWENGWCPPGHACIAHGPQIAAATFGGLAGTLHLNTGTYTLEVGTWAHPLYLMVGSGMSQAQFVAYAKALIKVPAP